MSKRDPLADLVQCGYCVLSQHFARRIIEACRAAFWPILLAHLASRDANRGPCRYFLPMPFERMCFAEEFFFDPVVLEVVRAAMGDRIVADQWGCDVPLRGSQEQEVHVDYRRPLFPEAPDLPLPPYILIASFGLIDITPAHGPIEIAPGTHRMPRGEAMAAVRSGEIEMQSVPLEIGDVLIRHPWALHRGTPNTTDTPRALATIRYVRDWYGDNSREVAAIPEALWRELTPEQRKLLRFPVGGAG
jgi:ectoine hydroxylase-related dioxygenase (phytanoyl-CoA dioxygenase family)